MAGRRNLNFSRVKPLPAKRRERLHHLGRPGSEDGYGYSYRIVYVAPHLIGDALGGTALPFVADAVSEDAGLKAAVRGGAPLADAAVTAGFYDQAHMTRHFRGAFGVSPGRWRSLLQ